MELDTSGGGRSRPRTDLLRHQVHRSPAWWIVGEFGKIMYTADGGATWKEQEKTVMEGSGFFDLLDLPTLFGIHATDGQRAMASGLDAHIARTTDGGARWTYDKIDAGDVPLLDPIYDVTELPDGTSWGVALRAKSSQGRRTLHGRGQDRPGRPHRLRSINFSADPQHGWMVGLRAHLPDDGRRQDVAALPGLSDANVGVDHEQ
jgi:hypothetical protein